MRTATKTESHNTGLATPAGTTVPIAARRPIPEPPVPDEDTVEALDHLGRSALAAATFGISPISPALAWLDWGMHLAVSPGKQLELARKRLRKNIRLATFLADCLQRGPHADPVIAPLPQDRRFDHPGWATFPFNVIQQSFLLTQQWWHNATTGISGVTAQHERLAEFYSRQWLDMTAPSNFLPTNPEVIETTFAQGGANLLRGLGHMVDDIGDMLHRDRARPLPYQPGRDVAVTPGEVVFRNNLIELIQYRPLTDKVHGEPLLIVPAWIMKYYILDLSPENSLIRYLVGQGHQVFCISWINPDERHRDLGLEDYLQQGVMAALDAVTTICGTPAVHALGYCLGGTLMSIAAAAMARDGDKRLKSLTLLATQVDFTEPGELGLFIDESQLAFLDDTMAQQGYLDQWQMAGAFEMLRSQDLVWSRMVRDYLMGDRASPNDLMSWNSDATRMPARMHSDYLRQLYLDNDLSQGRFKVGGQPVHLEDIHVPVFAVGTVSDHVAPWKSVFKLIHIFDTDVDFVLTSGGHNAGIVSEPGHPRRSYRTLAYRHEQKHPDTDDWLQQAEPVQGSWWPEWLGWLARHSAADHAPPPMGRPEAGYPAIGPAPGDYVLIR